MSFFQAATVTATLEKSNRVKSVAVGIAADQALVATGAFPVLQVKTLFYGNLASFKRWLRCDICRGQMPKSDL